MFVIRHSPSGTYDNNYSNQIDIYHGLRDQKQIPFGQGWGFGPVNPVLYNEWPDHDLRKKGSIYNVNDETEGVTGYEWGGDMMWQETGFWEKKYMPINVEDENGEIVNYNVVLYNSLQIFSVNNSQDIVLICFADVLLMHSELTKITEGINRVRVRAKLDPIASYSEEALQQERRFELAFENVRYYDLLRWYGKEAGVVLKKNMSGAKI
ncbi:MAG: RagB/SusD family nutrient uptake outer membrane protein [Tannerellaceae bacterium]|nr:RagB/SusD family nutrient uptake outer membrane protein [Tannerellaceae bacterium]